jgi:dihydrofolate reductase
MPMSDSELGDGRDQRRVVLKMDVSLDGFVATADGDVSWIFPTFSADATSWIVDTLWQAGTHVVGRRTYESMAAHWPNSTEPYAAPMNEIPKAVFSNSLSATGWGETELVRGDVAAGLAALKRRPGKDLLVHGGASFVQALSRQGLVDEYRLLIHPTALGEGLRLFATRVDLELLESAEFDSGAVARVFRPIAMRR